MRVSSLEETQLGETQATGGDGGAHSGRLEPGDNLGRYMVLAQVGRGAMGVVYAAYDRELDRKVALKVLRRRPDESNDKTSRGQARLQREAQAMAQLAHPNVVTVFDVGTVEGRVFVAMEFVEGMTLTSWLGKPRTSAEILDIFARTGRGLVAAHEQGLIHRDFKPDNVLVDGRGRPRVMDFGLARVDESVQEVLRDPNLSEGMDLTQTGALIGTPAYMAPEQYLGEQVGPAADQFAFCVALYEALFGQRPFSGDTVAALAFQVAEGTPREPPRIAGVQHHVRRAILRGLQREAAGRWPSVEALLGELARDPAATRRRWLGFGAVAAALGGAVVLGRASTPAETPAGPTCDADAEMGEVWGPEQDREVKAVFAASQLPYAEESSRATRELLDEWSRDWKQRRTTTCEPMPADPAANELVAACLLRQRDELTVLTELLREAEPGALRQAVAATAGLPRPERCMHVEVAAARFMPPVPEADRERVAEARVQLRRALLLVEMGRDDDAAAIADAVAEQAEEIGYLPLMAEATYTRGAVANVRVPKDAESLLYGATLQAQTSGHTELHALAAMELSSVLGYSLRRLEDASQWTDISGASLARLGEAPELEYRLEMVRGRNLASSTRHVQARVHAERARDLAEQVWGAESLQTAKATSLVASTHMRQGDIEQAASNYERALQTRSRLVGEFHPATAWSHANLSKVYLLLDRPDDAVESATRAIDIQREVYGKPHQRMGFSLWARGTAYVELGKHDEALADLDASVAAMSPALGEEHEWLAFPLSSMVLVEVQRGDLDRAAEILERADRISKPGAEQSIDPHVYVQEAAMELAWASGEHEAARELAARAEQRARGLAQTGWAQRLQRWSRAHRASPAESN